MKARPLLTTIGFIALTTPAFAELPFHGFLEGAVGTRVVNDGQADDDFLLEEARFQFDFLHDTDVASLSFRADLLHDGVDAESSIDVREANVLVTPLESLDLKVGRQVLTWGTGDLLFLNDLFPKDWLSFFVGRDDEYLKKPSDAVRASWYGDAWNVDVAWMPRFEPDGYISGERLSYWNPLAGSKTGPRDGAINPDEPDGTLGNGSFAGRIYGTFGGWETAVYGFRGHYGQPKGFDPGPTPGTGTAVFPRLDAWGASLQGALWGGVANAEGSWYRSLDNLDGSDPFLPVSEFRGLLGYSHELVSDQTLALQGYVEHPTDDPAPGFTERNRWWLTARYTGLFLNQNLILSWFTFYSPNENDAYLRPVASYKLSDTVVLTAGGNLFFGAHDDTFFEQFEDDTNLYTRVRYSF